MTKVSDNSDNNKKAMIEALEKTLGVVTEACKKVKIARQTHYRWLEEDSDYKTAVEGITDIAIDFAETQLHRQIREQNTTATIFYLKTKGKNRGYVERQETAMVTPEGMPIIQIDGRSIESEPSAEGNTEQ